MSSRTASLSIALIFAAAMPAQAQKKPAAKTPLPAIEIKLGDDDDSPASTGATSSLSTTSISSGVASGGNGSTSQSGIKKAISQMLQERSEQLKPELISWSKASAELEKNSGELVSNFTSPNDLQNRIKQYQNLKLASENLINKIIETFRPLPADLRKLGVPEENVTEVANEILADPERLMQRMKAASKMCDTAVQILTILKDEWGKWTFTEKAGVEFLPKFNPASKLQYNNALKQYQQDAEVVKKYSTKN